MKKLKIGNNNYISVIKTANMSSDGQYDVKITKSDTNDVLSFTDTLVNFRENADFLTLSVNLTDNDDSDYGSGVLDVYIGEEKLSSYLVELGQSTTRQRLNSDSSSLYYSVTKMVTNTP